MLKSINSLPHIEPSKVERGNEDFHVFQKTCEFWEVLNVNP